ncbi:hypothetical protein BS639_24385 [Rouxiella silvae]|uniref:Uncharacterized protein n=1 Tax=Rouxiella silvae TaxID=1646373 RepID=A0ABX3TTR4_9GAMM|nr:hypothetical protein BS639_24385 [Rouxiella silvae]
MSLKRPKFQGTITALLSLSIILLIMLAIAHLGIQYPAELTSLKKWIGINRSGFLLWRATLYLTLIWGLWKVWHSPNFKAKPVLLRMSATSLLFIVICEYVLLANTRLLA